MRRPRTTRKCKHCQIFFAPDPRSARRQRSCTAPACRQASQAASQRRWRHKVAHREDGTGPIHVARVRAWRQAHPGSWRRQAARPAPAFHDHFTAQPSPHPSLDDTFAAPAFHDHFFLQPAVFVGLLAH